MNFPGAFIVRHAPVPQNDPKNERLRGDSNPPVTAEGRRVALERAQTFQGLPIRRVYHDGRHRSRVMAHAIHEVTGAKIIETPQAGPWRMGELQGRLAKEAEKDLNRYMFQMPDMAIPKGESFNEFKRRWVPFLRRAVENEGDVIVTHLRNILTAKAWADRGAKGLLLDLSGIRQYQPFKKLEIAFVNPRGEFILVDQASDEREMVYSV